MNYNDVLPAVSQTNQINHVLSQVHVQIYGVIVMKDEQIKEYYTRYGPMVLRRCRMLLRDEEAAVDAMQDVFVKLLKNRRNLHHEYPSSLLFRIATNVCLNLLRSRKNQNRVEGDNLLHGIACYDEKEKKMVITDLLDRFFKSSKVSTREIAVMHFVYGYTLNEVAEEFGLSLSGIRKRIARLRQQVPEHFPEEVNHGF